MASKRPSDENGSASKRVVGDKARLGVAVVGYGPMGALHAKNVYASPATELLYIVGTRPESPEGTRLATELGATYSTSIEAVLADPAVDAIVVACPLSGHYDIVQRAILAAKPVMCEKPLAETPDRIAELYALAAQHNVPLLTAFHRRFDANFAALKQQLPSAGTVEIVRLVSLDPMERAADTSVTEERTRRRLYDSLLHDFDMALWLLGEGMPVSVNAMQASYDAIQVLLKFASGALVVVEWAGGTSFGYDQRVDVFGSGGLLQVENPPLVSVAFTGAHAKNVPKVTPRKHEFFDTRYPLAYAGELAHFVALATGRESHALVTAEQAVLSARIADLACAAIHHGESVPMAVTVPQTFVRVPTPPAASAAAPADGKVLGIALVGCGRMGGIRAERMRKNPRVALLWVVDANLSLAQDVAARLGAPGCRATADLAEALADANVGGVWISTPSGLHLPVIQAAAAAKKAIYSEKPIALTLDDIDAAYAAAAAAGVPLCCGWNRRHDAHFKDMKRRIEADGVSSAKAVLVNNGDHPLPPVSVLLGLGSLWSDFTAHDLDASLWLMGEMPTSIVAVGHHWFPEMAAAGLLDVGTILMRFASGAVAAVTARRCSVHGYDQRMEVLGENGNLYQTNDILNSSVQVHQASGVHMSTINNTFGDRYSDAYAAEVDHFAAVVLDGAPLVTSHAESKAVALLADACDLSQKTGKPVHFTFQ